MPQGEAVRGDGARQSGDGATERRGPKGLARRVPEVGRTGQQAMLATSS